MYPNKSFGTKSENGEMEESTADNSEGPLDESSFAHSLMDSLIPIVTNCIQMLTQMHKVLVTLNNSTQRRTTLRQKHRRQSKKILGVGPISEKRDRTMVRDNRNTPVSMIGGYSGNMVHNPMELVENEMSIQPAVSLKEPHTVEMCYHFVDEGINRSPVQFARYMPRPTSSYFKESPLAWVLIRLGEEMFELDKYSGFYGGYAAMVKRSNPSFLNRSDTGLDHMKFSEDNMSLLTDAAILLKMVNTPSEMHSLTFNCEECAWEVHEMQDDGLHRVFFPIRSWTGMLRSLLVAQFYRAYQRK